ncbi:MAG TPA: hypothetical protein VGM51_08540 [Armatimonadota bacterium]|jgi:hypothetical protein
MIKLNSRTLVVLCAASIGCAPALAGAWPFQPAADTFDPNALLDLHSLNEKTAGQSGFVRRSPDGHGFVLGNGKPVRFWAVTDYVQRLPGATDLEHHARWLAKRGVNMVRFHGQLTPKGEATKITDANREEIDQCWKLVAAMRKHGIYTTISPYWAFGYGNIPASWGVPGDAGQSPAALLFWDKTLQNGYKAWMRALLSPPNPYTGIPLAKDPAAAIIQLQNEDSMLFWTMQGVKGEQLRAIERRFGEWLARRYGSLEAAKSAWGSATHPDDDAADRRAGLFIVWEFTQPQQGGKAKRLADQLHFYADTMRTFDSEMARFLRQDLGCRQLINAGNWKTADDVKLNDVERYVYTQNDVIAVNRYFGGIHIGPHDGWAVEVGDHFTNASALLRPLEMPMNLKQVVGYPSLITESEWVAPSLYQSEGPFLTAAYQSLTGVDAFYWFSDGDSAEWRQPDGPWAVKWAINTPMQLGQFPAAALLYRKGYLKRGATTVHEERALEDLWQRRTPIIAEASGFDPNRDAGDIAPRSGVRTGVDALAFLVGPVEVTYGGDPAKSRVIDLKPYIRKDRKTVVSDTGEIRLNYGVGLCVLNAPRAQGAAGFLRKAGPIGLSDVRITSGNEYASMLAVSMDGKPLRSSGRVLVQVGTTARPAGWEDREADFSSTDGKTAYHGRQVVAFGHPPYEIEQTDITFTLRNPRIKDVVVLDANGNAAGDVPTVRHGAKITVKLPANAMYVVLR